MCANNAHSSCGEYLNKTTMMSNLFSRQLNQMLPVVIMKEAPPFRRKLFFLSPMRSKLNTAQIVRGLMINNMLHIELALA